MYQPLADKIRPRELDEMVGQEHIIGEGGILRRILARGEVPNMIFYGPSGVGKTTLAQIIAGKTHRRLVKLNATTASTADIREVTGQVDTLLAPEGVLLYLDEIQYFTKKQQQSLLEFMENGKITLIASTTENPYFYVYNAILSRSTIFEFKPIEPPEAAKALRRAFQLCARENKQKIQLEEGVVDYIAGACGGDVRKGLNAVELLYSAAPEEGGVRLVSLADAKAITQKSSSRYDRDGDAHYDIVSALMKSMRGSDPDAALHYLARLLEAGDLVGACRRILCSASEDVGLAYPMAVPIVKACVDSALQLGLPEAQLPLGEAVILLATWPKSNSACVGIQSAWRDVKAGKARTVPREMQNVHADGTGFEREQGYLYPHNYPGHWVKQQYLPDELKNARYYIPGDSKLEQQTQEYWDRIKKK